MSIGATLFFVIMILALLAAPILGYRRKWRVAGVLLGVALLQPATVLYAQLTDPDIFQSDRQMGQLYLVIAAILLIGFVGIFASGWLVRHFQSRADERSAGEIVK